MPTDFNYLLDSSQDEEEKKRREQALDYNRVLDDSEYQKEIIVKKPSQVAAEENKTEEQPKEKSWLEKARDTVVNIFKPKKQEEKPVEQKSVLTDASKPSETNQNLKQGLSNQNIFIDEKGGLQSPKIQALKNVQDKQVDQIIVEANENISKMQTEREQLQQESFQIMKELGVDIKSDYVAGVYNSLLQTNPFLPIPGISKLFMGKDKKQKAERLDELVKAKRELDIAESYWKDVADRDLYDTDFFQPFKDKVSDTLKQVSVEPEKLLPFAGTIDELVDTYTLYQATKKTNSGQPLNEFEQSILAKQEALQKKNETLGKPLGASVIEGLMQMPKYGIEFAVTGGIFTSVKRSIEAATVLSKVPSFATKVLSTLGGMTAQTAIGFAPTTAAQTTKFMTQDLHVIKEGDKYIWEGVNNDKTFTQDFLKQLPKGFAYTFVETAGERSGDLIDYMKTGIVNKYLQKTGREAAEIGIKESRNIVRQILKKTGWNGIFSEIAEEEITEFGQSKVQGEEYKLVWTEEGATRLLTEAITIGIYGGLVQGAASLAGKEPELDKNGLEKVKTLEKDLNEISQSGLLQKFADRKITAEETTTLFQNPIIQRSIESFKKDNADNEGEVKTLEEGIKQAEAGDVDATRAMLTAIEPYMSEEERDIFTVAVVSADKAEGVVSAEDILKKAQEDLAKDATVPQEKAQPDFGKEATKYTSAADFADAVYEADESDQIGTLSPDTITARDPIDEAQVKRVMTAIEAGEKIEPIEITKKEDGTFETVDGSQRITAFQRMDIPAPVIYRNTEAVEGLQPLSAVYGSSKQSMAEGKKAQPTEKASVLPSKNGFEVPGYSISEDGQIVLKQGAYSKLTDKRIRTKTDSKVTYTPKQGKSTLKEVLKAPGLYSELPEMKDVPVEISSEVSAPAEFNKDTGTIIINSRESKSDQAKNLVHEVQHVIQQRYGFAPGGTRGDFVGSGKDPFDAYQKLAGEVEARNTVSRIFGMEEEQIPANEMNVVYRGQVIELIGKHNKNGGLTFNIFSNRDMSGQDVWAVSIYPERSKTVEGKDIWFKDMNDFIIKNADLLAQNPQISLGTWYDKSSNKSYIDVVVTKTNQAEAELLGKKYNQKAIFNLKTFTEVSTGGTGESKKFDVPIYARLNSGREKINTTGELGFDASKIQPDDYENFKVETDKVVKRSKIAKELAKRLNLEIRRGKYRGKRSGIYKVGRKIARIKAGGMQTIMHEVTHFLQEEVPEFSEKNIKKYKEEFDAISENTGYGQGQPFVEGIAEFGRLYFNSPVKVKELAPRFYEYWEKSLDNYPELNDALQRAKKDIEIWNNMPATAKVVSQISFEESDKPGFIERTKQAADALYATTVDDLNELDLFVKMAKKEGAEIPAEEDPYILARNSRGWTGKVDMFLNKGTFGKKYYTRDQKGRVVASFKGKSFKDIMAPIDKMKATTEFSTYLVAQRSVELSKKDKATGIDIEDARAAIEELERRYTSFRKAAQEIYQYQNELLEYGYENGLFDKKLLDNLRTMSKNYVPFFRVFEEMESRGLMGKGYANVQSPIKRMKGSEREIINPLESIIKNTYAIIHASERNNVGLAMANIANSHVEAGKMFERVDAPMKKVASVSVDEVLTGAFGKDSDVLNDIYEVIGDDLSQADALVGIFRPSTISYKDHSVTVLRAGKQEHYEVEPDLYKAMLALNEEEIAMVLKLISMPAKWLRAGATLAPEFMVRNPVRDQWSAYINSNYGFTPIVDLVKGLFSYFGKDDSYTLWKLGGGEHAMMVSMDRKYLQKSFEEIVRGKKFTDYIKNPLEALQVLSTLGEVGTRLGAARRAVSKKANPVEAAYESREVTLDFARIGAKTKAVNMIIAFWNANVQGTDKFVRTFRDHPVRTTVRTLMAITLPSLLLYFAQRDDERWKEIPDWQKDNFWIIFAGDTIYRIPKPFGMGQLFGSVPERIAEFIDTKDPDVFNSIDDSIMEGATPGFIPTAALPIIENITNYSFFLGAPIVPNRLQNLPADEQFAEYTSEVSKKLGELTGYSPMKIDNLFYGYTAGLGKHAIAAVDTILQNTGIAPKITEPTPTAADRPVIKAFIVRDPKGSAGKSVNQFYEKLDELESYEQAMKKAVEDRDKEKLNKYKSEHPEVLFQYDFELDTFYSASARYFRQNGQLMSDLYKTKRQLYASNILSADEKRAKMDRVDEYTTRYAQQALKYYEKLMEK